MVQMIGTRSENSYTDGFRPLHFSYGNDRRVKGVWSGSGPISYGFMGVVYESYGVVVEKIPYGIFT